MPERGGADAKRPVGVRLEAELYDLLEQQARSAGLKPTPFAGRLLSQALVGGASVSPERAGLETVIDTVERLERALPARVAAELGARQLEAEPGSEDRQRGGAMLTLEEYLAQADDDPSDGAEG
jgi:hypothetical protein